MKILNLIRAEALRFKVDVLNYYPDQIVDIAIKYFLFIVIFQSNGMGMSLLTYLYWILATTLISELSICMSSEKQTGTIDSLMTQPYPITMILSARSYVIFLFGLLKSILLFVILTFSIHSIDFTLNFNIVLIFLISLIGFTGLGLLLAGLTLKYTKIASFEQLMMYGLLVVANAATNISNYSNMISFLLRVFPFTNAIYLSNMSITGKVNPIDYLILIMTNILLLILGLWIFDLFLKDAKNKGIANSY